MYKSLLITGGAGFIGSNFIHYWIKKYPKDKIYVLDSLTYASNIKSIKKFIDSGEINFIKGNINDFDLVLKTFRDNQISLLINFAAESHVDRSINSSDIFINSNILLFAAIPGIKKTLYVSISFLIMYKNSFFNFTIFVITKQLNN